MLFYRSLSILVNFIEIMILVRIVMSFINLNTNSTIGHFVHELTEPILAPSRALLAKLRLNTGMFDFSPIVAMLILRLIMSLARSIIF
ncbi:MAG: YggT family protein [Tissierellaceae bacterium]|nr:YggT family protein [Tissierellaceae bacterium]